MKQGLLYFTDTHLSLVGLIIFFASFFVLIILQQKMYRSSDIKKIERLPFQEDNQ